MPSNLRSINLNLLPILRELIRRQNVTRAAEALNMRQSTVSEALGRIRELLHDEILVPQGRQLALTSYARRLEASLEESLSGLEALFLTPTFTPAELRGTMVIATTDYVALILGPRLIRDISTSASALTIQFIDVNLGCVSALRLGEIDAVIIPLGVVEAESGEFDNLFLFEDDLVFLVDKDSPERDQDELLRQRFAFFCADRDPSSSFQGVVLNQLGVDRKDAIRVSNFSLLPYFVEHTENVAVVQRRLADRLESSASVRIVEPSTAFPKARYHLVWNKARSRDPAHEWLRSELVRCAVSEPDLPEMATAGQFGSG